MAQTSMFSKYLKVLVGIYEDLSTLLSLSKCSHDILDLYPLFISFDEMIHFLDYLSLTCDCSDIEYKHFNNLRNSLRGLSQRIRNLYDGFKECESDLPF